MRKRIRQLARGQFDYEKPILRLPELPIRFSVMVNQDYEGSFRIGAENSAVIRGMVYSTQARMEVLTPTFEGTECEIKYRCHGGGLEEGALIEGDFYLVVGSAAAKIPYQGIAAVHVYESTVGSIRSLPDFARLARENWQEAYRLFYNPGFSAMLSDCSRRMQLIYKAMIQVPASEQNLEEFLVGCDLKKQVLFETEESQIELVSAGKDMTGHLDLLKDGWGYLTIAVSCTGDFLIPEKQVYAAGDFLGNGCRVNFTVDTKKLHRGINLARLTFQSCCQTHQVTVIVRGKSAGKPTDETLARTERTRLLNLYRGWRVRSLTTADWAARSLDILEKLEILCPREPLYALARCYILIQNRQRKTAENLLTVFNDLHGESQDTRVGILFAYLKYLLEKEGPGRDRYAEQIENLYLREGDRRLVFYVWYLLQKVNCNEEELFQQLRGRMSRRDNSVFLYAEYYSLLTQKPDLIQSLDKVNLTVLVWAMRHSTITENVAERVMVLADASRQTGNGILLLLEKIYLRHPDKYYLGVICRYLMKARLFAPEYLEWYERGIEQEVRITGLYEAYLQSLDENQPKKLPKILQMYFQYDSPLPYQKMAVLYRNIIAGREQEDTLYQKYLKNMSHFALEQAQEEHINSNLAVIYNEMLPPDVVNERLAVSMARLLFTHKVTVSADDIVSVVLYQWQLRDPQEVPVTDHAAYVQIWSQDYVLLLEDASGNRYVSTREYTIQSLMDPERYMNTCLKLAPEELPFIITALEKREPEEIFTLLDERSFDRFLLREDVSAVYKAQQEPMILSYYAKQEDHSKLKRYLAAADYRILSQKSRQIFTGLMLSADMMDHACEKMREYGPEVLKAEERAGLLGYMARKMEGEADDQLVSMMIGTFLEGKYNCQMIGYLCQFYAGPSRVMTAVWSAAGRYQLKIASLEERILITAMYTDENPDPYIPVFLHYYRNNGRELILQAFLSVCSQKYFTGEGALNPAIFEILKKRYAGGKEQNDACRLALLRCLAEKDHPDEEELTISDRLLEEYTGRNMSFAFYKTLDVRLKRKYHLSDQVFLEYRAKPGTRVIIHISRDEDGQEFHAEEMREMYCGIYVKSFIIFFGELIRYYITEENGHEVELQESSRITLQAGSAKEEGRYAMLNQILISQLLREDDQMEEDMLAYRAHMNAHKNLFGLL